MREKRSTGASAMPLSIAMDAASFSDPIAPTSRIAMEQARSSKARENRSRSSNGSLPIPVTPEKQLQVPPCIAVEIVRAKPGQIGLAVQPRRWVVERFFAGINRNRRLAKDFETTIAAARAFLYAASVMILVRRLARST